MFRVFVRRSSDLTYFTDDPARELDGVREAGPGWWLRGAGELRDPHDVERVLATTDRSATKGYAIVVAAPRPISILVALEPDNAPAIVAAHRTSVAASMEYLEQRGLVVRRQSGDEHHDEPARWERIVSFTHGVNRHGEPHLHDHVLVGARPDGERTVLDSRSLFVHVPAADALYRSSLRHELASHTPWVAWRSFKGIEHVGGLDEGYRSLWGGHHDTRGEKLHWERDDALNAWRGDRLRFEPEGTVATPRRSRDELDEHSFAAALEGRNDVARRHLVAAWANAAVFGESPGEVAKTVDRLYPELALSRGVRETTIGVGRARMTANVREHGPRPLRADDLAQWTQRSRERSRSDLSR